MTEFTDDSFDLSQGLTIVDFWSPWCAPCNMLNPIIKNLSEKNKDITIGKLNTMENPLTTKKFSVSAVPTILFFKNGNLVKRLLGYKQESELQKHIDELK